MVFDVSMGVRRDDRALRRALDRALARNHAAIQRILDDYHVPRVPTAPAAVSQVPRSDAP